MTRGKGVAVHRAGCSNLRELVRARPSGSSTSPGASRRGPPALYPVDLSVEASDRRLLRDVSEVLAKEKINVTGVRSQSVRDGSGGTAFMTFTVEIADASGCSAPRASCACRRRARGAAALTG